MVCNRQHLQNKGHESEKREVRLPDIIFHLPFAYVFIFAPLLGRLLQLCSYYCVPAQGELPLPGLPHPGLQQEGGGPAERHVPLREV